MNAVNWLKTVSYLAYYMIERIYDKIDFVFIRVYLMFLNVPWYVQLFFAVSHVGGSHAQT